MLIRFLCGSIMLLAFFAVNGQTPQAVRKGNNNTLIAISTDEGARNFQSQWGYAPAVRSGDYIHMSGVIAGPAGNKPIDSAAFKESLRRTFSALKQPLASLNATLDDVVKINTYHVFDSEYFSGDKLAHMEAIREVKNEFLGHNTPAWTAIGVSELFTDTGLVEIELTLYAPIEP
ncbi:MAG: Rid family hydrolase [Lysobacterales bacterium]